MREEATILLSTVILSAPVHSSVHGALSTTSQVYGPITVSLSIDGRLGRRCEGGGNEPPLHCVILSAPVDSSVHGALYRLTLQLLLTQCSLSARSHQHLLGGPPPSHTGPCP